MLQNICSGNESFITDDISSYEIQIDLSIYLSLPIYLAYVPNYLPTYLPTYHQSIIHLPVTTYSVTHLSDSL